MRIQRRPTGVPTCVHAQVLVPVDLEVHLRGSKTLWRTRWVWAALISRLQSTSYLCLIHRCTCRINAI